MDKQKKSLICMYIDDFCGIRNESFNFCIKRRYEINDDKYRRKIDEEIKDFPSDFWGNNVSDVTLLIGENGSGKTTLMRLLIKWLCQLSVGNIPQEKGALIIEVGEEYILIAFSEGKSWKIEPKNKKEEIRFIEDREQIKELLSDVRMAYYTDTMTDLELSEALTVDELEFLYDDSLLTRLSNAMKDRYTTESVKRGIKQNDFIRQMSLFLRISEKQDFKLEFPIRHMKFTAIKGGNKYGFKHMPVKNESLENIIVDFWNSMLEKNAHNNMPDIAKALLWGVYYGTIVSLINWESANFDNLKDESLTDIIKKQLSTRIRISSSDGCYSDIEKIFKILYDDCENYEKFCDNWGKCIKDDIPQFINALNDKESDDFWGKWELFEDDKSICKWQFRLECFVDVNYGAKWLQRWKTIWEKFQNVEAVMPDCVFDWRFVSSGETNLSNLYTSLFDIVDFLKYNGIINIWYFIDEPDNTFHPEWERSLMMNFLEICSTFDEDFQLLIATHSPILLSDVPKQSTILLKKDSNQYEKSQEWLKRSSFGQQIYTLFNDAFFMKNGIIGAFADKKIGDVYKELYDIEKMSVNSNRGIEERSIKQSKLNECNYIINLIEEPMLHGNLLQSYNLCKKLIK